MSQPKSTEGLEILNMIREILLENERLKSANEELLVRNVELSSTIAELNIRLAVLQAAPKPQDRLISLPDAPGLSETLIPTRASGKKANTGSQKYVSFFSGSEKKPTALIKAAKQAFKPIIKKKTTAFMVVPNAGFTWKEVPDKGSWFKPAKVFLKGGGTTPFSNRKFQKTIELVAYVGKKWCYMGSFKAKTWTTLGSNDFLALSTITREMIITQTGGKAVRRLHDFRSMYVSGELGVFQIDIQRVGFNREVCQCLLDAANTFPSEQSQYTGPDDSESQDDD